MTIDYEYALISCLLSKPEFMVYASEIKPEYFENDTCRLIFTGLSELKKPVFPEIVRHLEGKIDFKVLLDIQDLIKLSTKDYVEQYSLAVIENYKEREIRKINGLKLDEIEDKIRELKKIGLSNAEKDTTSEDFCSELERIYNHQPDLSLIKTDFYGIDDKIRGFGNSELIIIGARPAMGKSTLALNLAYNMAKSKKNVMFFSLEMSELELHKRLVKVISGCNDLYNLTQDQFNKLVSISRRIKSNLPLKILDKGDNTVEDIFLQARKAKDKGELDAVFIDHLSILKSKKQFKSRYEELSEISRKLKIMAKDLNVPVVALCQLNRGIEKEENKTPTMADLRDSGSIEQDADLICFIHRPEYYIEMKGGETPPEQRGQAFFIISKNRRGAVGKIELGFDRKIPTFYNR